MPFDDKPGFPLHEGRYLPQGAKHQIGDAAAFLAADVMMVCPSLADLVTELTFLQFQLRDQVHFLQRGERAINGNQVGRSALLLQYFVQLRGAEGIFRPLERFQDGPACPRQPMAPSPKFFDQSIHRLGCCALLQMICNYYHARHPVVNSGGEKNGCRRIETEETGPSLIGLRSGNHV